MTARGFTLVELMVATAVLLAVCGALAALAGPARVAFDRTLAVADTSSRGRASLETLLAELRQAGAGAEVGPVSPSLADLTPVIIPDRSLDDQSPSAPYEAIGVLTVPVLAAQALLLDRVSAGAGSLRVDRDGPCPGAGGTCGFDDGMPAVVYDSARLAPITVASATGGGTLWLVAPLGAAFEPGAVVVAVDSVTYGLRTDSEGTRRLVRRTAAGAEQPIVDHVVDFEVRVFGSGAPPESGGDVDAPPEYGPLPPAPGLDDERDGWPPGENCTMTADDEGRRLSRMETLAGSGALVLLSDAVFTDGPWCPDAAAGGAFDADLLRIRRIDIRLRVEAASATLRGPAGRLFRRPGTARQAGRWVPDVELQVSVALRNR